MCSSVPFPILLGFFVEAVLGLTLDPFRNLIRIPLMLSDLSNLEILFEALQRLDFVTLVLVYFGGPCW